MDGMRHAGWRVCSLEREQVRHFAFAGQDMASEALTRAVNSYENHISRHGVDEGLINDYSDAARTAFEVERDIGYGLKATARVKELINGYIAKMTRGGDFWWLERKGQELETEYEIIRKGYDLYKLEAPHRFESYCIYMEKNRKYEKRFYLPRRKTLGIVASDLQDLENGKMATYGLSMPSRTGKSTICVFFLTWVGLRKPDSHNAMGGHSGQLARRFFSGLSNLVETPDYAFAELFEYVHPEMRKAVERKSSDPAEYTINLGTPDEFATFTCRGIDGTWTGAIDVSPDGYLYVDDLVRDREHSLSPSRMENTYQEYQNKMLDRMNDGAKKLLVGTLWSVLDPLERERKLLEDSPNARFRRIPALDENDESNFQYEIKGFSTQYYLDMRERLDPAEWMAKFQQRPFVREGLSFPIEELRFFDGNLPDGKCRTVAALDPAFGQGDSLSMPVCKDFGERQKYIVGWVHDRRSPGHTVPRVVDAIDRFYITRLWVEKNSGGQFIIEQIQREMDSRGIGHCRIEPYSAPERLHKEEKISGHSDYVKRSFLFLVPKRKMAETGEDAEIYRADDDYRKALDEMTMWSAESKRQRDDAPDAIASLAMKMDERIARRATITASWI